MKSMMTMAVAGTLVIILAIVGVVAYLGPKESATFGDTTNYNPLPSTYLNDSGVLCTTSSTLLLATSTSGRPIITLSNDSANAVFLGMNSSGSAKTYQGLMIPASSTITLNHDSLYLGAIYCIGLGGNATTSISGIN